MSSAGSISGGQGLYQFLHRLQAGQGGQGVQGPQGAGGPPPGGPPPGGMSGAHGHHGGKGGAMMSKIESAVTDALNSSSDDSDADQTIQDAISKVLGGSSDSTAGSTTDPSSTDGTAATQSPEDAAAARQSFFETLKEHGIDPKQFRQDLMAALKQAHQDGSGEIDRSTAFASVPAGVAVDVAA